MFTIQPELPQWTELGEQLAGAEGDSKRDAILGILDSLEHRAEIELRSTASDAPRVLALLDAVQTAKKLAHTLFKPVDLSSL